MKLLGRNKSIPVTRKPDYDFIQKVEKECRIDDNGFDERIDEAILEKFWSSFSEYDDETPEEIEKLLEFLYNVSDELHSQKYQDEMDKRIQRYEKMLFNLSRRDWDERHVTLRNKMVERGKRRHN